MSTLLHVVEGIGRGTPPPPVRSLAPFLSAAPPIKKSDARHLFLRERKCVVVARGVTRPRGCVCVFVVTGVFRRIALLQ